MKTVEQIKLLRPKEKVQAMVAVVGSEVRKTTKSTNFLSVVLADKTGTINGKIWDWNTANESPDAGTIWLVDAEYSPFKDSPQVVLRGWERVNPDKVDKGLFIDSLSVEEFRYYRDELERLIKLIGDEGLRMFVHDTVFRVFPAFLSSVGAKANHHARLGGLLEHSVHVTKSALAMARSYQDTPKWKLVNTDILIAGGILHDLSKIGVYTTESNVIEMSLEGTLMGSYDMSPSYLSEAYITLGKPISYNTYLALTHILVTHHGPELSECPPSTFSAWLVHAADLSDCFVDAVEATLTPDAIISKEKNWMLGNKAVDERKL